MELLCTAQGSVLTDFVCQQVEPAPVPPPLKSPWAEVVRQHTKPKDGAVKETSPRAPAAAEPVKPAASQAKDRQGQRSKDLPSYARTGPSGPSQSQQRPAEASARAPARNAPQPAAPNAANGGRAPASVKPAQPKPVIAPPARPSTPAVSLDAMPVEPEGDAMSSSSTADKGTPRQHQEVSSASIDAQWASQQGSGCICLHLVPWRTAMLCVLHRHIL